MEGILDYLKRKLRSAGPRRWAAIAAATGCSEHTMRKVAYNDIENPGVVTMQPLLDFFLAIDRGEAQLPEPTESKADPSKPTPSAFAEKAA